MTASYRFIVEGRVQGVGFRQFTRHRATKLGLQGWVRNRADGAVEGLACGDDAALETLRQWLQRGPSTAQVARVNWAAETIEPADPIQLAGFRIER